MRKNKKKGKIFQCLLLVLLLVSMLMFTACGSGGSSTPVLTFTPEFSQAQKDAFRQAVDAYFDGMDGGLAQSSPFDQAADIVEPTYKAGISVAVYKDGVAVWTYAKGIAAGIPNMTPVTPMTAATPGYVYSITKTHISALVLKQIEDGLYELTDTVADLLADHPDYIAIAEAGCPGNGADFSLPSSPPPSACYINVNATVEQLLKHISGMPDYASNLNGLITMGFAPSWKPADILTSVVHQAYFADTNYRYSNTNYVLLGMIAEHKGGSALNSLLASNFFTPLNMNGYLAPQDAYPANIAHPYDDACIFGGGPNGPCGPGATPPLGTFMDLTIAVANADPPLSFLNLFTAIGRGTWAAGGLISTAANVAKWGYALYDVNGAAISPTVRAGLLGSVQNDGDYGYGASYWEFEYNDGTPGYQYGHGGGAPGYRTLMVYESDQRLAVAILTNANSTPLGDGFLVDRVALADALFNCYKDSVFEPGIDITELQVAPERKKVFGQ